MMNMHWEPLKFDIPQYEGLLWHRTIDTSLPSPNDILALNESPVITDSGYIVNDRSIVVLTTRAEGGSV
jgi:glycogen operon protein